MLALRPSFFLGEKMTLNIWVDHFWGFSLRRALVYKGVVRRVCSEVEKLAFVGGALNCKAFIFLLLA